MQQAITRIHTDLSSQELISHALQQAEGILSKNEAFVATTGSRTGRSPKDRFIVKDAVTQNAVAWGSINQPISVEIFDALWQRATDYLTDKEVFISNLSVGAASEHALPVKVTTERAWHNLFTQNLFIRSANVDASNNSTWELLNAAGLKTNPERDGVNSDGALIINMTARKVLLCGMPYAGEMKKALFSIMNFLLPSKNVLPMHCAANVGEGGDVALFFGLSGTGKTTLSADPERYLIGDDEHGWSDKGVFNFEGGCYAKCINLSKENEPMIWDAIRYGAIMENVVLNSDGEPDFADDSLTQNTRAAYPLDHISKRVENSQGGHPQAIVFLTCDLYGLLPPVALLNKEQAAYHFLSGYTALVGGTEVGQAVQSTFSTCFGEPFFPRFPKVYAELLMKRIEETGTQVYWVNTGWSGGGYSVGQRFSIPTTRAIVRAILNGELKSAETFNFAGFNIQVPKAVSNVDSQLLNPRKCWQDKTAYDEQLASLIQKFNANFKRFDVSKEILDAAPVAL